MEDGPIDPRKDVLGQTAGDKQVPCKGMVAGASPIGNFKADLQPVIGVARVLDRQAGRSEQRGREIVLGGYRSPGSIEQHPQADGSRYQHVSRIDSRTNGRAVKAQLPSNVQQITRPEGAAFIVWFSRSLIKKQIQASVTVTQQQVRMAIAVEIGSRRERVGAGVESRVFHSDEGPIRGTGTAVVANVGESTIASPGNEVEVAVAVHVQKGRGRVSPQTEVCIGSNGGSPKRRAGSSGVFDKCQASRFVSQKKIKVAVGVDVNQGRGCPAADIKIEEMSGNEGPRRSIRCAVVAVVMNVAARSGFVLPSPFAN